MSGPTEFRIAGVTSLQDRLRACWKEIDPTEFVEPDAMMRASALLAEAAAALDERGKQIVGGFRRGDVAVLRIDHHTTRENVSRIREYLTPIEKDTGVKFVVIDGSIDVVGPAREREPLPNDEVEIRVGNSAWTMSRAEWFALANDRETLLDHVKRWRSMLDGVPMGSPAYEASLEMQGMLDAPSTAQVKVTP